MRPRALSLLVLILLPFISITTTTPQVTAISPLTDPYNYSFHETDANNNTILVQSEHPFDLVWNCAVHDLQISVFLKNMTAHAYSRINVAIVASDLWTYTQRVSVLGVPVWIEYAHMLQPFAVLLTAYTPEALALAVWLPTIPPAMTWGHEHYLAPSYFDDPTETGTWRVIPMDRRVSDGWIISEYGANPAATAETPVHGSWVLIADETQKITIAQRIDLALTYLLGIGGATAVLCILWTVLRRKRAKTPATTLIV